MARGFVTLESFQVSVDGEEGVADIRLIFRTKNTKQLDEAIRVLQQAKGALESGYNFFAG